MAAASIFIIISNYICSYNYVCKHIVMPVTLMDSYSYYVNHKCIILHQHVCLRTFHVPYLGRHVATKAVHTMYYS